MNSPSPFPTKSRNSAADTSAEVRELIDVVSKLMAALNDVYDRLERVENKLNN